MAFWRKKEPEFDEVDRVIRENSGARPADIARATGTERSTVSRRLASMEEAYYLHMKCHEGLGPSPQTSRRILTVVADLTQCADSETDTKLGIGGDLSGRNLAGRNELRSLKGNRRMDTDCKQREWLRDGAAVL
ncbi:MAG: helix-turn-helix domain-containing protein [Caldilineaceae bacterium]